MYDLCISDDCAVGVGVIATAGFGVSSETTCKYAIPFLSVLPLNVLPYLSLISTSLYA